MARGFRQDGLTHTSYRQPGAAAMMLACRKKNGLASSAGSISGRRLEVTRCTCWSKVGNLGLQTPLPRQLLSGVSEGAMLLVQLQPLFKSLQRCFKAFPCLVSQAL